MIQFRKRQAMKIKLKLQQKILLLVLGISLVIYILVLGYISINARNRSISNTKKLVEGYADKYANEVEKQLTSDMETIETTAEAVNTYELFEQDQWKNVFAEIYGYVFRKNPQFYAIYDSWELSFIDSTWDKPYGRYSYEYYRENGRIKQGSKMMSMEGDPQLYAKIKEQNKQAIVEPYLYSFSGQKADEILMTSLVEPLQKNGNFIGMIGADISLENFQEMVTGINPFQSNQAYLLSNNAAFVGHTNGEFLGKRIQEVWPDKNNLEKIKEQIKAGDTFSFISENSDGRKSFYAFSPILVGKTDTPWSLGISVPFDVITQTARRNFFLYLSLGFIGLIVIGAAVAVQSKRLIDPIKRITDSLKKIALGDIDNSLKVEIHTQDEIEEMGSALNTSIDELNKKKQFAEKIKEGDLEHDYKLASDKDVLGKSLIEMRNSLKHAREEEEKRKQEDEKRRWANEGLAKFAEILRQDNENLERLGYNVLSNLVKYLKINQGGLFILNDDDSSEPTYDLLAAYAYNRKKHLEKSYQLGEGLIGTCAQEQKTIYMTDLPDQYINITSGLGDSTPRSLLIVPLKTDEKVLGVIELASFEPFENHQIEFVEKVGESIAATLSSVRTNIKTSELLEKSQQQAEEMSAQEEEMRQNMEELQATQEEAARRENEMKGVIDALDTAVGMTEMDTDGRITKANSMYCRMAGVVPEEIIGTQMQDFLDQQQVEYNQFK